MIREFISTSVFDRQWLNLGLTDSDRRELEVRLIQNPLMGEVIPGCNGLRKVRIPINCKGLRGGGRVIYIDFCRFEKLYFLTVYSKSNKEDLTMDERNALNGIYKSIEAILKHGTN